MTIAKRLVLSSAAALVFVGVAQAADLPTKKGAPAAECVEICNIDGVVGFVLPGSDTCVKISGFLTGQMEAGNLSQQYVWAGAGDTSESALAKGATAASRDGLGFATRGNLALDAKTNTAYGVLTSRVDLNLRKSPPTAPTSRRRAA